jgi:hypothetical protein
LTIHYKLKLFGRVVALSYPITMNMTHNDMFDSTAVVEPWTFSEKHVSLGEKVVVRERRFGYVFIIDER